jgi:hypothetical protein
LLNTVQAAATQEKGMSGKARIRLMTRPNGLAFSCRERATDHFQNTNDLAREAVNCNAGLGGFANRLNRHNLARRT